MDEVVIVGIGLHPFGRSPGRSGLQQGIVAVRRALEDAGLAWRDIDIAFGGSRSSGNAAAIAERMGLTGLPFINLYTGCATGGSALVSAVNAIRSGAARFALAVGFDKHERGAFAPDPARNGVPPWVAETGLMVTTQFFGLKLTRYMHEHGLSNDTLVRVAVKALANGANNPKAWRRRAMSFDEVAAGPMVSDPLNKYMFCSPSEGGAAIILSTAKEARRLGVKPVSVNASILRTRRYGSFEVYSSSLPASPAATVTEDAAAAAFAEAGIGPQDIDVVQLQDTEVGAELMHMAESGFCRHGEQERLIRDGATAIGGSLPVNTDGGCLANGEPIGASGLRQVYEVCLQLRGQAGARQVPGQPRTGFTQVYGAPGLASVNILSV